MDNPNPPAQDTQDYYSFDLTAGQTATVVAESLNGEPSRSRIVDGNGNVLATGVSGATNVSQSIENFVAPATGTYYIEITGDPGLQYSVAVTRGADFQPPDRTTRPRRPKTSPAPAACWATSHRPPGPLYILDDNLYSPPVPDLSGRPGHRCLHRPSIPAPATEPNNPFGLNMAYDGTYIYYNNGAEFGNGRYLQAQCQPRERSSPRPPRRRVSTTRAWRT